jgi:pimeloyl-ACP methyl ester carboxylesterase
VIHILSVDELLTFRRTVQRVFLCLQIVGSVCQVEGFYWIRSATMSRPFIGDYRGAYDILFFAIACILSFAYSFPVVPNVSPATGLANQFYTWKEDQSIRFQCVGPEDGEPVVLVHGLFVNSDHWRKSLKALGDGGYRVFALDLWGCGYSDKPAATSQAAQLCNGENGRFNAGTANILLNIELGTATGGDKTRTCNVELRHPLGSPYNFYTWSDLISDFCRDIVLNDVDKHKAVTLVSNSIGTISSLQAVLDNPSLYKGVFVVCPNFRELHSAEIPLPSFSMPVIRGVQSLLRTYGQTAFDALAKPDTVKQILKEPYAVTEAVDDTLVQVLLDPLLTEGASQVVFDTLSYSAGPLPEQQLSVFPMDKPVWICYGTADPWTPGPRVEALKRFPVVESVEALTDIGHCPHDEAPELVHPLLFRFLERLNTGNTKKAQTESMVK